MNPKEFVHNTAYSVSLPSPDFNFIFAKTHMSLLGETIIENINNLREKLGCFRSTFNSSGYKYIMINKKRKREEDE